VPDSQNAIDVNPRLEKLFCGTKGSAEHNPRGTANGVYGCKDMPFGTPLILSEKKTRNLQTYILLRLRQRETQTKGTEKRKGFFLHQENLSGHL
jgi:hypothetical protein